MVEATGVEFCAYILGPTRVCSVVADVAQRDAPARSAGARRFHTSAQVVQTANVVEEPQILLLKEGGLPLLLSLLALGLRQLGLWFGPVE